ncbi:MAG: threonine synthase [Gammaproteobacteria bacterium]|nr:MAG: threonine synthase [Gammaproteobacteria bacterium]
MSAANRYTGLIDRYRDRLPLPEGARAVSLGEGATPLIRLENLPRRLGLEVEWYVKFEGLNPTGSFKDRGMTVAVSQALAEGRRAVVCASTGNTSASAAAYAARAGMAAFVLIPEGRIALGKLAQAVMHGARVLQIQGNFDQGLRLVRALAEELPLAIVNSINPYRLQGQKTIAFEIVEALGRAPDYHTLPVGNAGNISAHWIGYSESAGIWETGACTHCAGRCLLQGAPLTDRRPVMVGYQARGAAPFLQGAPVAEPETVATAIRIGDPQSWNQAWAAVNESGGWFDALDDEAILAAQRLLAETEGVFCEPASAAAVAGAMRDLERGRIPAGSLLVSTLTGHGLKDPDIALRQTEGRLLSVPAELAAVREAVRAGLEETCA